MVALPVLDTDRDLVLQDTGRVSIAHRRAFTAPCFTLQQARLELANECRSK